MDETMRFKTALSTLPRLAQVDDGELPRFAKTRLGDDLPMSAGDLLAARDIARELGRAIASNDAVVWKRMREARDVILGVASTPEVAVAGSPHAAPAPSAAPPLQSHMVAQAAKPPAPSTPHPIPAASLPVAPPAAAHPAVHVAPPVDLDATMGVQFVTPLAKSLPFQKAAPGSNAASTPAVTPTRREVEPVDKLGSTVAVDASFVAPAMPFAPVSVRGAQAASPQADASPPASVSPSHVPEGQRFTFAQYASLRVEIEAAPEGRGAVLQKYGVASDQELGRIDWIWQTFMREHPTMQAKFTKLREDYLRYLSQRRPGS